MWAMVVTVDTARTDAETQRAGLEQDVLPHVPKAPGFRHGSWAMHEDGRTGIGYVVYDTEEQARSQASGLVVGDPAGADATVTSVSVYEVLAEAAALQTA